MIIKLDWYNCTAHPTWETQIHQLLEEAAHLQPVSHATVRVEEMTGGDMRFHLVTALRMSGPDILAHGDGSTFDEALLEMSAKLRRGLRSSALHGRHGKPTVSRAGSALPRR